MSLSQERSECIQFDLSRVGDRFGWLEEERGIDLYLIDREEFIEREAAALARARAKYKEFKENSVTPWELDRFNEWCQDKIERKARLDAYIDETDRQFHQQKQETKDLYDRQIKVETETVDEDGEIAVKETVADVYIPTHWAQAKKYWDYIYTFICQHPLAKQHLIKLWHKVVKAKESKAINTWYYFHIAYHCAHNLGMTVEKRKLLKYAEKCKKDAKLGTMWNPAEPQVFEQPDEVLGDGTMHASMSLDMEGAIDLLSQVRQLAKRHDISPEEAYDMILDSRESR